VSNETQAKLPVDPVSGCVPVVLAANAVSPFTYSQGVKIDANGNVVVAPQ